MVPPLGDWFLLVQSLEGKNKEGKKRKGFVLLLFGYFLFLGVSTCCRKSSGFPLNLCGLLRSPKRMPLQSLTLRG